MFRRWRGYHAGRRYNDNGKATAMTPGQLIAVAKAHGVSLFINNSGRSVTVDIVARDPARLSHALEADLLAHTDELVAELVRRSERVSSWRAGEPHARAWIRSLRKHAHD